MLACAVGLSGTSEHLRVDAFAVVGNGDKPMTECHG